MTVCITAKKFLPIQTEMLKLKESWQIFQKKGLQGSESAVTVQLLSKSAVKVTHLY